MNLLSLCNKYMLSCLSLTFYTFAVPHSKFSPSTFRNPVLTVLRTTTCFLQEAKQVNSFAPHSKRQLRPLHRNRQEQSESTRDREGIRWGINHYKSAREVAKQVTESMPWDEACCELRLSCSMLPLPSPASRHRYSAPCRCKAAVCVPVSSILTHTWIFTPASPA